MVGTITHYNLRYRLNMTMMKYMLRIAILIPIVTVVLCWKGYVQIKLRTKLEKQCLQKRLRETTAKWLL